MVPFPLPNSILDTPDHRTKWNEMCSITVPSDSLSVQRCWKIFLKNHGISKKVSMPFFHKLQIVTVMTVVIMMVCQLWLMLSVREIQLIKLKINTHTTMYIL